MHISYQLLYICISLCQIENLENIWWFFSQILAWITGTTTIFKFNPSRCPPRVYLNPVSKNNWKTATVPTLQNSKFAMKPQHQTNLNKNNTSILGHKQQKDYKDVSIFSAFICVIRVPFNKKTVNYITGKTKKTQTTTDVVSAPAR